MSKTNLGPQSEIDLNVLNSILFAYKSKIYDEKTGTVLSKTSEIWEEISAKVFEFTKIRKSSLALYTYVVCKKIFAKTENKPIKSNGSSTHSKSTAAMPYPKIWKRERSDSEDEIENVKPNLILFPIDQSFLNYIRAEMATITDEKACVDLRKNILLLIFKAKSK